MQFIWDRKFNVRISRKLRTDQRIILSQHWPGYHHSRRLCLLSARCWTHFDSCLHPHWPAHLQPLLSPDKKDITIICKSPEGVTSECDPDQAVTPARLLPISSTLSSENQLHYWSPWAALLLLGQNAGHILHDWIPGGLTCVESSHWLVGRKWMIFGGLLFHIAILLIFVIEVSPYTIIVFLFLLGFKAPLTISIIYLLIM